MPRDSDYSRTISSRRDHSTSSRSRNYDSRRHSHDEQVHKLRKDSFYKSFSATRKIVQVEHENIPTCKVSNCRWKGFDDELLSHCMRDHQVFETDEEDRIKFQNWEPSVAFQAVLLNFKSVLLWLYTQNNDTEINVVVQYAAVENLHDGFRYNVSLDTKGIQNRATSCKIAPGTVLCTKELFAKYKYTIEYQNLIALSHLPLILTLSITSDRSLESSSCTRFNYGCENFGRVARKALREKFTCPVCLNFIEREARFCTRGHAVCSICFPRLKECPMCRGEYGKDTRNVEAECLLRFLRFPQIDMETH